eukprot:4846287-Pleurochrysis_carterae.AAC.1
MSIQIGICACVRRLRSWRGRLARVEAENAASHLILVPEKYKPRTTGVQGFAMLFGNCRFCSYMCWSIYAATKLHSLNVAAEAVFLTLSLFQTFPCYFASGNAPVCNQSLLGFTQGVSDLKTRAKKGRSEESTKSSSGHLARRRNGEYMPHNYTMRISVIVLLRHMWP